MSLHTPKKICLYLFIYEIDLEKSQFFKNKILRAIKNVFVKIVSCLTVLLHIILFQFCLTKEETLVELSNVNVPHINFS